MEANPKPGQKTAKRRSPGRVAKNGKREENYINKRKRRSNSPQPTTRTVRPRLSVASQTDAMATPLTLEALQKELATSRKEQMDHLDGKLLGLNEKIASNSVLILEERKERKNQLKKLNDKIEQLSRNASAPSSATVANSGFPALSTPSLQSPFGRTRIDDEYHKYERARSSLVFYPIPGETNDEMLKALQVFLTKGMKIPKEELKRSDIALTRRVRTTRNARARKELLVLFTDQEIRDFVLSHARNLSGHIDSNKKPTAGVRIEVPTHLLNVKRSFDEYGYMLKMELGNSFKRNVRYDDTNRTLVMDVKYPGEGNKWDRITYEQARRGISVAKSLNKAD